MRRTLTLLLLLCASALAESPELALKTPQGQTVDLRDYRGKAVVVNFWATWCTPCASEMKNFVKLSDKYREKPVAILAASLDDERTKKYIEPFMRSRNSKLPVLLDATADDVKRFGGKGTLPFTVVLGKEGEVVSRFDRPVKEGELARAIEDALAR